MTTINMNGSSVCNIRSPLARFFFRAAMWQERRHYRRRYRFSLSEVPEHLRQDIGLDGGAPLQPTARGSRSFAAATRMNNSLNSWYW